MVPVVGVAKSQALSFSEHLCAVGVDLPHEDDTASGAKTTWVPRLEIRTCGHSFVDRVATERGWVQGARLLQSLCLARKGNAANSLFQ